MKRRFATFAVFAVASLAALGGAALVTIGTAQTATEHISFVFATGSTGGTYFPVGQAIANIVSHPPGVARCDAPGACGPAGLVASVRTSEGSIANVLDVNAGRADGALAQSDIVAEAVTGKGDFRKYGAQRRVRIVADLFPEDVHLVARVGAHIARVSDLRGKRVILGARESGSASTARAILAAFHVPEWRFKASYAAAEVAADRLERGEADAVFFVGGAPVGFVRALLARGKAVLVPIDGAGRDRLVSEANGLSAKTIPADAYGRGPVETVSVDAVLIVNDSASPQLVYGITKALFNPANRALLDEAHPSARFIRVDAATRDLPAPLHAGAARFYREVGIATQPRG